MPRQLREKNIGGAFDVVQVAKEIAEGQEWGISRQQLLGIGVSARRIQSWLRMGRLYATAYPGVYVWGRPEVSEMGELITALLYTRTGSALDGPSALWWQKLLKKRPPVIHIAAPGRIASRTGLLVRHPRIIQRHAHEDLPVVDLASALLRASLFIDLRELRIALSNADFHHLLHLPSLQSACRLGPPGSKALRKAMGSHLPQLAKCRNDFEIDFVLLCESAGLTIPEPNEPKGHFIPDMTWESRKLIVELDGKDAHTSPAQKIRDERRQEWLEARGYTVIRFTWGEVYFRQRYVVEKLRPYLR